MPNPALGARLRLAIDAVATACRITRQVQQRLHEVAQMTKDDRSPVTVADFAVQAVIAMHLGGHGPLRLVGEESSDALRADPSSPLCHAVVDAVRTVRPEATLDLVLDAIDLGSHDASSSAYWTIDPIDGTKGFLRGQQYAVSLAHIEQGIVTLGVLGCANLPAAFDRSFNDGDPHGQIFFAERGIGCFALPADEPNATPRRVQARTQASGPIQVCASVEKEHSSESDTDRVIAAVGGAGEPVRLDSQCKYAVIARGQADAYLRLPTRKSYLEKIWDHAAGQIVAAEAGAIVSDIDGKPLDFSRGATLAGNRGIVCASQAFHARLIGAIAQLGI
ncbi:MAG: 3'(2'),5'-bisphosphate nucleotidase [Gammaproteobacteria bacterium]|nr:3'(2'),5'-bisphosphate nucleotidase [Gammaproteobacteria bacterium]